MAVQDDLSMSLPDQDHGSEEAASQPGSGSRDGHPDAVPSPFIASSVRRHDSAVKQLAEQLKRDRRVNSSACVLAVGTANPTNCITQDQYTDWYFQLTKSDHLTHLKGVMKKTCDQFGIRKRYIHVTDDLVRAHPELLDPVVPSIDTRLQVVAAALPELAAAAATKAITEWGRPAGDISHLVFSTSSSAYMPGADVRFASILGLNPTVQRTMICFQACTGGAAALRVAKDIAENNRGARVLVTCADLLSVMGFRAPDEANPEGNFAHAVFADGAGAVVIGADPQAPVERPVFEMVSTAQATVPGTERFISCDYAAGGLIYNLVPLDVPVFVSNNIERCLSSALGPLGIVDSNGWNSLFWVVHPGSHVILNSYEKALGLEPEKMASSRRVLREYGNMIGPGVLFVLDDVVRRHREDDKDQREGRHEWGVLVGLGPRFTVEMIALRVCSNQ